MPSELLSFAQRADPATLPEWMDAPCPYEEFRDCLRDLAQVNRLTLAYRPTLNWLGRMAAAAPGVPLRIVDVGCGGGDMLRRVARWSNARGVSVELTGIDMNPHAIRAAREFTPDALAIEYLCGDAYGYEPPGGIDVVISSLMTHHLGDEGIVCFLRWMERSARRGWFINDLRRSRVSHQLFRALAVTMRWHRFVQHDGPVSIRRSFRKDDWLRLCTQASVGRAAILRQFPFRLCVGALK